MGRIIFITGTDTGAGKTVLTVLLLRHLRAHGVNALAMKPFCSGSRADARLLRAAQDALLTLDEINPFYFRLPVAPAAAAGRRKAIHLDTVLGEIRARAGRCDVLLVEGIGGLLVPLGRNYTVADVIKKLRCPVVVVGRNRLGILNHTLLTLRALQGIGIKEVKIVMMGEKSPDISARTNLKMIRKLAPKTPVFAIPNLGREASRKAIIKINVKNMKITLARILEDDSVRVFFR